MLNCSETVSRSLINSTPLSIGKGDTKQWEKTNKKTTTGHLQEEVPSLSLPPTYFP